MRRARSAPFDGGQASDAQTSGRVGHHQPSAALAARPTSSTADSSAHSEVWLASDTAARNPSTGATFRVARASTGMTHQ